MKAKYNVVSYRVDLKEHNEVAKRRFCEYSERNWEWTMSKNKEE